MRIDFKFIGYGIITLAGLALVLAFLSKNQQVSTGAALWGEFSVAMQGLATFIAVLFFIYIFTKLFLSRGWR